MAFEPTLNYLELDLFLDVLGDAIGLALTIDNLVAIVIGLTLGALLGAIPGLSGTMAIALIIPLTYAWPPLFSIALLVGCWKGSVFGGSISAILLNTPGTASASATAIDGFPLTQQGKAGKALKVALFSSVGGALMSDLLLFGAAPPISRMALMFGPSEFASLILFSLVIVAGAGSKSKLKGLISTAIGILLATVGLDPITAQRRFTFDILELDAGIPLLAMLVGLLVVSEILLQVSRGWKTTDNQPEAVAGGADDDALRIADVRKIAGTVFRCSLIGSFCGALPGVGSITAAFMGYSHAKAHSKEPKCFGSGDIRGVAGPEAANNAVCGAGLIPLVTLGVPGALTAAVIMGAFLIHGLRPGPMLMIEQPQMIYGLFVLLLISDILITAVALPVIAMARRLVRIPRMYLFPLILVLCVIGTYGTNQSVFDIKVMVLFGIFGYFLKNWGLSPAALLIAFILGPMAEVYLRQALEISGGSAAIFVTRPISLVFLILATAILIWNLVPRRMYAALRKSDSQSG